MPIISITTGLAALVTFQVVLSVMPAEMALADEVRSVVARSPNGKNAIRLQGAGEGPNRRLLWTVTRDGKPLLGPAPLQVALVEHGQLAEVAQFGKIEQGKRDEAVDLPRGKSSAVRDHCSWARVNLTSVHIHWQIELRAYDDGVALRYVLPKQENADNGLSIRGESTEYRFASAPTVHFMACERRVVLLGDRAGKLLESNLLVCLNDERPAGDFSWAKPGKSTWHWWNGTSETGLPFATGMNLATHKHYIDFCARHGIAYHAVVADDSPWYVQTKKQYAPAEDTDIPGDCTA